MIGAMVSGCHGAGCFQETSRKRERERVAMASDILVSGWYGEWVVW